MRAVVQRVKKAKVTVDGSVVGSIKQGLLVFIGIHMDDTEGHADTLALKCSDLRVFSDQDGKMNRSLKDIGGEALVVSQFTLYGDCKKGCRPSFKQAAPPDQGKKLYTYFVKQLKKQIKSVCTGIFGAMMDVELINDGPVTLIIER